MKKSGAFFWGLVIGAAAGAVAALLLAPDKGSVTREKLKNKAHGLNDDLKETMRKGKEFVDEYTEINQEEKEFGQNENIENQ